MNKPAQKEPSMDEILSSIRQIIADDDAGKPRTSPVELVSSMDDAEMADSSAGDTLELSQAQIVKEDSADEASVVDFSAFVAEPAADSEFGGEQSAMNEEADMAVATQMKAEFVDPDDVAFDAPEAAAFSPAAEPFAAPEPRPALAAPSVRQRPSAAQAAPMPDPTLSQDIADELLEPATNAAVKANFARLTNFAIGNAGVTIEQVIRDMLRPMLKEWLDEHLPAVVERMVEKEISRIANGN